MTKLKRNIRSPQGLPETMGFSMLPHSHSTIAITNRLTGSQFRLWHYLMMVDPFADRTRNGEKIYHPIPSPAEIAVAIGASQRTVEKDMKRLEELGLYAKRITQWEGYNTTAEAGKVAAHKIKNKSSDSPEPLQDKGGYFAADPAISPDLALNSRTDGEIAADPAIPPDFALNSRNRSLEPLPDKDSGSPQTIQTYTNFIQTLSDAERENFRDFCKTAVSNFKQPVIDIDDWLAGKNASGENRWDVQYQNYLAAKHKESQNPNNSPNGSTHCGAASSTNVQNFESWNTATHEGQHHTLMNIGLAKFCENALSKAWYEWARARHPERFVEVPE
jgi:biotin operon repressor